MFSQMLRTLIAVMTVGAVAISTVFAHEMTIKGTVEAVQPTRIQIKTGEEKKGQPPGWYQITTKTQVQRGKAAVPFAKANITIGERVVVIVDHEANGTLNALEIRLAAR